MSGLMEWEKQLNALHVISLGAGRQSSAMYLMAVAGEIEPSADIALFADTGNEPPHVYDQLEYLMKYNNVIPISVVSAGNIYDDSMAAFNGENVWGEGRWLGPPVFSEGGGPIRRSCTRQYKIEPLEKEIRRYRDRCPIINWRGHTIDEVHRAKPDKRKFMTVRWPLLEARMSDNDCAMWLNRNGYPLFKWSACEICPFRLRELDKAKQLSDMPDTWQRITMLDSKIRDMTQFGLDSIHFLNAEYEPMEEFVKREDNPGQISLFGCDGGACGL